MKTDLDTVIVVYRCFFVFFFKQKTAYEMRISDWSSDVCSSDLAAQEFAAAIGKLDCRIALEQFGAGLDSFQLLAHLKPNMVKIDRSFVEELPKNQPNQDRIREIATKARELGIRTIAEFVSDAARMSILFSAGVDYVEGNSLAGSGQEDRKSTRLNSSP